MSIIKTPPFICISHLQSPEFCACDEEKRKKSKISKKLSKNSGRIGCRAAEKVYGWVLEFFFFFSRLFRHGQIQLRTFPCFSRSQQLDDIPVETSIFFDFFQIATRNGAIVGPCTNAVCRWPRQRCVPLGPELQPNLRCPRE